MISKKANTSLTIAIIVTIVTAFTFLFLFLFLGINHRQDVYDDSKKLATEISRNAAFETQVYLLDALSTARFLEQKAELILKLNGNRKDIDYILKAAILKNENYLGVWTLWEPNAFDQKDYLYQKDSLFNEQGSLGISYFRNKGQICYEIMKNEDYNGEYYKRAKELKTEIITEPYHFAYSGYKEVFFGSSVSVPILIDGGFKGVIGVDIDLENLQERLNTIRPYETGYLALISNKGKIITHPDTSFINKNIFGFLKSDDTLCRYSIEKGKELTYEVVSEFTGEKVFRIFYPILIGKGNNPWSMMIEIPLEKATSRSRQLLIIAIVTLILGLSLLLYLVVNILDRRKYERQILEAKNKAEESDRLKTAFLNNISHEIRTPLNGILGFTELIVHRNYNEKEIAEYYNIIRKSSDQLLSVISNVIKLSKIQARIEKLTISDCDIDTAIKKVVDDYAKEAQDKGLELKINAPTDQKKFLLSTDVEKFKQILSYLLNNALKFTDQGLVEVGYYLKDEKYFIYVKDSGIGINPENAKSIFNYFSQGNTSTNRASQGLGVGLAISKSFIDSIPSLTPKK